MSDLFEKADELIKKAAGAPMKPVFRPVDYAFHYGQLLGAVGLALVRCKHLPDSELRGDIDYLSKAVKGIQESIAAQNAQNEEALK